MSGTPGCGGSSTTTSRRLGIAPITPTSPASPSTRRHPGVATTMSACSTISFVAEGKDAGTVGVFAKDLAAHGGNPEAVDEVCIDMSPAVIAGTAESLPNAQITFDKFHVVKLINQAVDAVRRAEQKSHAELKKSRYLWLKNPRNLSERLAGGHGHRGTPSMAFNSWSENRRRRSSSLMGLLEPVPLHRDQPQ